MVETVMSPSEDNRDPVRVPPSEWIPHPVSDYLDWMDKRGGYFGDLSPEDQQAFLASLSPDDRLMFEPADN